MQLFRSNCKSVQSYCKLPNITRNTMFRFRCVFYLVFFTFSLSQVDLLENGVARSPPMGWMSWGYYMCGTKCEHDTDKCLNEKLIMAVADSLFTEGYQEAGYEYIIIDDCWAEMSRDKLGRLVPDKKRFPRGMKFLSDYIHSKGLKFGMYTNIADVTCMLYPGSKGHFSIDAKSFASWGVDYLKVDGCFVSENDLNSAYKMLGYYLNMTGRPMVYSCSWPYYIEFIHKHKPDLQKVSKYCNMWRNYHDVVMSWNMLVSIINYYEDSYKELAPYHGPGSWNDPDMLLHGTGALLDSQSRIQIALYAMWSAPLLLSCDMTKVNAYEKELLMNLDLIAIGQDSLGIMAKPYKLPNHITLWVKPHQPRKGDAYPTHSFAFVNLDIKDAQVTFFPRKYGLNNTDPYTVFDVFSSIYIRNITITQTMDLIVPGHDVILYTLYPL